MDTFRGCLVVLRIFIGSQVEELAAPVLLHADGFGLTVADLVAPGFLFIMGLAVPVSMSAFLRAPGAGDPGRPDRRRQLLRIGRRAVLLYAIGTFLNAYPFLPEELAHLRFTGVLQRLAVVYLVVSLLYVSCAWSLLPGARTRVTRLLVRGFLLGGFPLVGVAGWIVATYTFHSPWPECADVHGLVRDCSLEAYLDTGMWGTGHNFNGARFDPEGLLSTVVAAVNCWAGLVIGIDIVRHRQRYGTVGGVRRRASLLIAVGVVCVAAGLALGLVIPIGKQLWTPSYALVTVGIMTVGFGAVLLVFDGGLRPVTVGASPVGSTLVALGRNPLFFYVLSEVVIDTLDYLPLRHHGEQGSVWSVLPEVGLASWLPGPLASAAWAALWLLLFYVPIARLLVARGWYIRV
ncbi:heparan-alpha-glucosaminide N-acetyltransferase domain-containing protein [Kitasatospora viridis]|uniref:heparan-alpha-glucosaminide N-acetyltransferase domain-containing protein n=1 Tax=Kitasatospora viridis TaxID=281105 RepID=UPI0014782212|nr:heparan-alpha-glucosaminide N-acetyltransferase domain-containing protein [Kitasatospora viridis]